LYREKILMKMRYLPSQLVLKEFMLFTGKNKLFLLLIKRINDKRYNIFRINVSLSKSGI
jgi:hypothetical protein